MIFPFSGPSSQPSSTCPHHSWLSIQAILHSTAVLITGSGMQVAKCTSRSTAASSSTDVPSRPQSTRGKVRCGKPRSQACALRIHVVAQSALAPAPRKRENAGKPGQVLYLWSGDVTKYDTTRDYNIIPISVGEDSSLTVLVERREAG